MTADAGVALVLGAGGVAGRAALDHFTATPGWTTIAASRTPPETAPHVRRVAVDLLDPESCRAAIASHPDATHAFFAAYLPAADPAAEVETNLAMLANAVDALEARAPGFRNITLVHGQKWYGNHLGPYRTPAKEDDPRHMPPNFYYDQQDFIEARQRGKPWTWASVRIQAPLGFSLGSPMNQLLVVGLYGSICRELGLPLEFPGREGCYDALYQVTDLGLLGRAMHWVATTPACANKPFNVTNGDLFRWRNLWPRLAEFFGVPVGQVRPRSLAVSMADKGPLWDRIVARHGLEPHAMEALVDWRWGDFVFGSDFDNVSSTVRLRRSGFAECLDSEDAYLAALGDLRARGIIP
jgi:nucleoside-diphosphate-sugar epimerase